MTIVINVGEAGKMLKFFYLFLFSIALKAQAMNKDCDALIELSKIMTGQITSLILYDGINIDNAKQVTFVIHSLASDLNLTERVVDTDKLIVERFQTDYAGNISKELVTLSKDEFYLRIKLVKDYVDKNKKFPIMPLNIK